MRKANALRDRGFFLFNLNPPALPKSSTCHDKLDSMDTWLEQYEYLTTHIIPGPRTISYFIPLVLLPLALIIPPSVLSRFQLSCIFLPMIYGCLVHSYIYGGVDAISVIAWIWSTVLLALQDCRGTYRYVHVISHSQLPYQRSKHPKEGLASQAGAEDTSKTGDSYLLEESYPNDLYRRIYWVLTLLFSIRLSCWKIGDSYHDKNQPPRRRTRKEFIKIMAKLSMLSYLILDTAAFYSRFDRYFTDPKIGIDDPLVLNPDAPSFFHILEILPPRFVRCSAIAAQIFGIISFPGGTLGFALITVVNWAGLISDDWSPQSWPLFFGPFSGVEDRGIRGLWGTWWHQTMRYPTSIPGRSLAAALGVRNHSALDYAFRTISAFFLSGIVHTGLVPPEPKFATIPTYQIKLYIAGFFWVQTIGFGFEMVVSKLIRLISPGIVRSKTTRFLTYLWVALWFCLTLPIAAVAMKELGYGRVYPFPISLWHGVTGRGWVVWAF